MNAQNKRRLVLWLTLLFAASMIFGTGPGILLVNRPVVVGGLPLLYWWGLAWYVVQVVVIVIAYRKLFGDEPEERDRG